jgi:carbon monoxide dehydrogenase subunit G
MPRYRTEITVPRDPEEVFDYLARFSSAAQWDPSVVDAEMLTPEPVGCGSEFRLVVRSFGSERPFRYRISAFDRPRSVTLVAETAQVRSLDTITVEPAGAGSKLSYDARLEFRGLARLATPILALTLRRMGDAASAGLRAEIGEPA